MATTTDTCNSHFSSDIPFTLFCKDLNQYSLHDLSEDNKKFLWHQFMLNVLLNIPQSLTTKKDIIEACSRLTNENDGNDGIEMNQTDIDDFQANYTSENAINWYTRTSFFYRVFNKACRTLNSDAIVPFHPIVKDLTNQLRRLHKQQKEDGTLKFPFTVYRGQTQLGKGELDKIRANEGGLISMNTFLSTTTYSPAAITYVEGADGETAILFEITVNDPENKERSQIFARVDQDSKIQDEEEVLFGMSSVFKVISVVPYGCFWIVQLELTSCQDDKNVQKFMEEIKSYLYQISGKQAPFIVFKQLFTTTSLSRAKPLTEFVKYVLVDVAQLFVNNAYKKEGELKKLIDMEPVLHALVMKTNTDVVHSNERSIYLLFDLLNNFFYRKDENVQEVSFDKNDVVSLFCFGGFLLLTGNSDKAIEYFQILLKHDSINDMLKSSIHAMLGASYVMMRKKELASEYFRNALELFESSTKEFTPPWLSASIASMRITQNYSNQTLDIFQPFMNKEHSDNDVHEKLRLIHLGHIYSDQLKFVDAINHWEEAIEITSYLPSSLATMVNGAIYVQMAAAYLRLNSISKALNVMETSKQCLESYYPSTHRLFGGFNFMYGYYLIQNGKPSKAIPCLEKALKNPYFSNDNEFLGIVYTLLVMAYIHKGNLDSAERYCYEARPFISPTSISAQIPALLEAIPELKMIVEYQDRNYARQFVRTGLQFGQRLISTFLSNSITPSESIDEQTCTIDQLIAFADYYRHRQDNTRAQTYYIKALDKTTEIDSKCVWNIYRKIRRMNNNDDNDQYRDYFALLYSKYDDDNPKHFQIISTLQIIMYKLFLTQNQFDLAFNCLIHGIFMKIKFLHHQNNIQSKYISDLFYRFIHEEQITKLIFMLTKLIQIYFTDWSIFLQDFLSTYFTLDLAKIIHHEQIDKIINEIKCKSFSEFLHTLLELLRQSISPPEKSILSLKQQILEFLQKYNDENASLFYLMKIFESLLLNDTQSFLFNLEQFRLNTITFERYEKFKEKLSNVFQQLEEDWLYKCLQNIAKNL